MQRVFQQFIDGLVDGPGTEDLRVAMEKAAAALDLACFAYLILPHVEGSSAQLISNYPSAWTTHYLTSHYERLDPVIQLALSGHDPFQWGPGLGPVELTPQQRELFQDAAFFGIRFGFTIPIHDGRGPTAAVTYASQERSSSFQRCIEHNGRVLQLMALYFHAHARRRLNAGRNVGGVALTPREFECLQWAAHGKTAWEIAAILGISRRTASFHLDNARAKLGVHSICQAVARLMANQNRIT
jgi:DNA-binding CsgD family transcriptional regulator